MIIFASIKFAFLREKLFAFVRDHVYFHLVSPSMLSL